MWKFFRGWYNYKFRDYLWNGWNQSSFLYKPTFFILLHFWPWKCKKNNPFNFALYVIEPFICNNSIVPICSYFLKLISEINNFFFIPPNTSHCEFLEYWNTQESVWKIWHHFSCLLEEGIPKIWKKLKSHGGFLRAD